jgi:hypothetical protein
VGGSEFRPFGAGTQSAPPGIGEIAVTGEGDTLDAESGVPVGLNYTDRTNHAPESGTVETVTLDLTDVENLPETLRAYLMVDAYPAAVNTVD